MLDDGAGGLYPADVIELTQSDTLVATFLANTVPVGTYSVVLTRPEGSDRLPDGFEMGLYLGARLETSLILPGRLGYHAPATIWIEYTNSGDVAMRAPLLVLRADQNGRQATIMRLADRVSAGGFWTSALPVGFSNSVQFLASGATPGLLQPGETIRAPVQWSGWQPPWFQASKFDFRLGVLDADNSDTVDWASERSKMQPAYVSVEAWNVIWENFLSQVGNTWGEYVTALSDNASYLGRLGVDETDLSILLGFELTRPTAPARWEALARRQTPPSRLRGLTSGSPANSRTPFEGAIRPARWAGAGLIAGSREAPSRATARS
ncbi:MAG: hypothetical protein GY703_22690 [Gammaproteobacteria bacterium]|nr:hypothetical protein [Gammaproteobacteria bacterium]